MSVFSIPSAHGMKIGQLRFVMQPHNLTCIFRYTNVVAVGRITINCIVTLSVCCQRVSHASDFCETHRDNSVRSFSINRGLKVERCFIVVCRFQCLCNQITSNHIE